MNSIDQYKELSMCPHFCGRYGRTQCVGNVSVGSLLVLLQDIWSAYKLGTKGNHPNPTTAICSEYTVYSVSGTSCHSGVMSPYSSTLTTILAGVLQHDTKLNPLLHALYELRYSTDVSSFANWGNLRIF